jgi:hypothetical protein
MIINATASYFDKARSAWVIECSRYQTAISNRKRAIHWALAKIERDYPGFPEYEATIED